MVHQFLELLSLTGCESTVKPQLTVFVVTPGEKNLWVREHDGCWGFCNVLV
jgi:hypothetical protein